MWPGIVGGALEVKYFFNSFVDFSSLPAPMVFVTSHSDFCLNKGNHQLHYFGNITLMSIFHILSHKHRSMLQFPVNTQFSKNLRNFFPCLGNNATEYVITCNHSIMLLFSLFLKQIYVWFFLIQSSRKYTVHNVMLRKAVLDVGTSVITVIFMGCVWTFKYSGTLIDDSTIIRYNCVCGLGFVVHVPYLPHVLKH